MPKEYIPKKLEPLLDGIGITGLNKNHFLK